MDSLKYKYELLKEAIITGDFSEVIHEIKSHLYSNKNIYVILTFLIVLYSLYEQDYVSTLSLKNCKHLQLGGDKEEGPAQNTIEKPEANNTPKKGNNTDNAKKSAADNNNSSASSMGKASQLTQGASGLCDGNGTIAKMCRGGKDGVTNYFKFFGYLILAGLAVLSPFVIYIVLVYMMLKIMFTGLKNV
jgi:hypothetical protein